MRPALLAGLTGLLIAAVLLPHAQGQSPGVCQPAANALGVSRVIDIDTTQGPIFGSSPAAKHDLLRDHEVVLTFDDGPHAAYTKPILDALDAHCTKATFFMVGWRALTQSRLVREVAHRGHTVATHTWSHQNVAKLDPVAARAEIELGISAVQRALGSPAAPFFRFPYLSEPRAMVAHLKSRNTGIFAIDIDSIDYRTRSPTMMVRNVMQQLAVKGKGIILMHDIQPATAGGIKMLLAELKAGGYMVVHLRPTRGQVTVAEFDRQVDRDRARRRIASLPVPVGQRGIVSPAWEVNVFRSPQAGLGGSAATAPTAERPSALDDWRHSIFRTW
ncbi:MAG: polysaccharide deacetylase family protein [Bacteroidota bacterium]